MSYEIGELSEKYETGGRGPGFISDGDKWDPGGDSYGSYQLASKVGTLQGYLRSGLPYTKLLNQYPVKSIAFNKMWKELATNDPTGFKQSQFDYVKTLSYDPCRQYATAAWGIADTFALNSALFSTANQSGGWKKILDKADINPLDSEIVQINKLYDARAAYFKGLLNIGSVIRANIIKSRTVDERADCLKLVAVPKPLIPIKAPLTPAIKPAVIPNIVPSTPMPITPITPEEMTNVFQKIINWWKNR